jgi:hypothetical protein
MLPTLALDLPSPPQLQCRAVANPHLLPRSTPADPPVWQVLFPALLALLPPVPCALGANPLGVLREAAAHEGDRLWLSLDAAERAQANWGGLERRERREFKQLEVALDRTPRRLCCSWRRSSSCYSPRPGGGS